MNHGPESERSQVIFLVDELHNEEKLSAPRKGSQTAWSEREGTVCLESLTPTYQDSVVEIHSFSSSHKGHNASSDPVENVARTIAVEPNNSPPNRAPPSKPNDVWRDGATPSKPNDVWRDGATPSKPNDLLKDGAAPSKPNDLLKDGAAPSKREVDTNKKIGQNGDPPASRQVRKRRSSITLKRRWAKVGHCQVSLKGEDGFCYSRWEVGGDVFLMVLVADGHGGKEASAYCVENLFDIVIEELDNQVDAIAMENACRSAFSRVHKGLLEGTTTAGTAATLILINETKSVLVCASVGDAFAVLLPDGPKIGAPAQLISANHRIDENKSEQQRILDLGGTLGQATGPNGLGQGPLRAWPGGVACARSLGDADCKDIILPTPDIHTMQYQQHMVLAVASDGVWDAVATENVALVLARCTSTTEAASVLVAGFNAYLIGDNVALPVLTWCSLNAVAAVGNRGLRDDTTCVVIGFSDAFRGFQFNLPQTKRLRRRLQQAANWAHLRKVAPSDEHTVKGGKLYLDWSNHRKRASRAKAAKDPQSNNAHAPESFGRVASSRRSSNAGISAQRRASFPRLQVYHAPADVEPQQKPARDSRIWNLFSSKKS